MPTLLPAAAASRLAGFDAAGRALDTASAAATEWTGAMTFTGLRELIPSTHLDYWIHHNARQFNAPLMTADSWLTVGSKRVLRPSL